MSVLVKGMEMPESCPCKLVGVGYDLYCSFTSGIPSRMREYVECCEKETRPDWCPLAEIPTPHGKLIDADALHYSRIRIAHNDGTIGGYNAVVMSAEIKDATTIIEAEEKHD